MKKESEIQNKNREEIKQVTALYNTVPYRFLFNKTRVYTQYSLIQVPGITDTEMAHFYKFPTAPTRELIFPGKGKL